MMKYNAWVVQMSPAHPLTECRPSSRHHDIMIHVHHTNESKGWGKSSFETCIHLKIHNSDNAWQLMQETGHSDGEYILHMYIRVNPQQLFPRHPWIIQPRTSHPSWYVTPSSITYHDGWETSFTRFILSDTTYVEWLNGQWSQPNLVMNWQAGVCSSNTLWQLS